MVIFHSFLYVYQKWTSGSFLVAGELPMNFRYWAPGGPGTGPTGGVCGVGVAVGCATGIGGWWKPWAEATEAMGLGTV